jgi:peptidyl-prolyl cis-trans isomerase C
MKKLSSFLVLSMMAPLIALAVTPEKATDAPAKPAAGGDSLFGNTVVAKGKGVSVTQGEIDQSMVSIKANYASHGQPIPEQAIPNVERQLLQQLISIQLLNGQANETDKTAGKVQAEKTFQQFQTVSGSDEAFERQLTLLGITRDQLKTKLVQEATAEAVLSHALKADVSDADVKKFYEDNPAQFEQPERVHVAHILLSTKDLNDTTADPSMKKDLPEDKKQAKHKQLEDLLKRARSGEDFHKLAEQYSEDPGVKINHGDYTFSREEPYAAEFKAAAFGLAKTNDVSDIVQTVYGYHIIKLLEKLPAQKVPFSEVSTNIKEYLHKQAIQQQVPGYLKKLQQDAKVEILDERLKPVNVEDAAAPAPTAAPKTMAK